MAISTLDGALAGMLPGKTVVKVAPGTLIAGRCQSFWGVAGNPGAGTWDATLNGVALSGSSSQVNGQIPFTDPVSGNTYLNRFSGMAAQAGMLVLADRIWHNQLTVNSTTAQTITTPSWGARDNAGTSNGDGILLGIETSAAASATAAALTVTYTNQAGTGSKTASFSDPTIATATIAGAFFRIGLAAGDTGVRSVQSVTFSTAWTTGTINMVAYRPLAYLELTSAFTPNALDTLTTGFPRLFNGTVPYLFFIPSTTTSPNITASVIYSQG